MEGRMGRQDSEDVVVQVNFPVILVFSCYYFSVFETNRGPVKRMKFAPGKGNMKLIILFEDGIVLWEGNGVCIVLICFHLLHDFDQGFS